MSFNPEKLTVKSGQAIRNAQEMVEARQHRFIRPLHLLMHPHQPSLRVKIDVQRVGGQFDRRRHHIGDVRHGHDRTGHLIVGLDDTAHHGQSRADHQSANCAGCNDHQNYGFRADQILHAEPARPEYSP